MDKVVDIGGRPMLLSEARAISERESKKYPRFLVPIPKSQWPFPPGIKKVPKDIYRSRDFMVQVYEEDHAHARLSICRTSIQDDGRWDDGISWDEIMKLKAEAGYIDFWAVEIYPPSSSIVNVANMRHIFVLKEAPPFAWKKKTP